MAADAYATLKMSVQQGVIKTCGLTKLHAATPGMDEMMDAILGYLFDPSVVWAVRQHLEDVEGALEHQEEEADG